MTVGFEAFPTLIYSECVWASFIVSRWCGMLCHNFINPCSTSSGAGMFASHNKHGGLAIMRELLESDPGLLLCHQQIQEGYILSSPLYKNALFYS